ncbi:hypothetical protein GALMADRAFT_84126 [Galerina marginata CBS 339.88]|uniref:Cytochrome P450 n=1 Tax=Galerina marginata (strain CBS 339.88) TaxID=685588 RepID=A0A067TZC4_GALM3|nr:hypothetical protein GALMADRAFT_84126 [Galerina marginata CBS 339.88]
MEAEGDYSSAIFVVLFVAVALGLLVKSERAEPDLKHIPAIGWSTYLLSYLDAFKFSSRGTTQLSRGYNKYRSSVFKISTLKRWLPIITGTHSIEELRKATEDEVSFANIATEPDASLYFIGHCKAVSPQHLNGMTRHITQNTTFLIPDLREEIMLVLRNATSTAEGSGWQEMDAMGLVVQLTSRAINRVFVGLPYARNEEFSALSTSAARDVYGFKFPLLCTLLPKALFSIIRIFSDSHTTRRRLHWLVTTFVRERKHACEAGHDKNEPNNHDLLSWTLNDECTQKSPENLLSLSITANQTISMTFGHVLYHLAANPKYAAPMRKEIEGIVMREGWSKSSLERMRKVDSFVKESMRMSSISSISMMRKVMKPFTFSDGTHLPQGALVAVAAEARHLDSLNNTSNTYSSPLPSSDIAIFDGFRFSNPGPAGNNGMHAQFQLVTTTADALAWGYGRHACPGRFFAAVVLKMMLAHVVLHYDVRFEDGVRPRDVLVGLNRLPDPDAKVLVRKR